MSEENQQENQENQANREQVMANIALLKFRFATLLQQTGTPIRDVIAQRFNSRLGTLGVNPQTQQNPQQQPPQPPPQEQQQRCPNCGHFMALDTRYCPQCGYAIAYEKEKENQIQKQSGMSVILDH